MPCTFHASPNLQGRPWYDWAYFQYDNDSDKDNSSVKDDTSSYFPSLVLGFVQFPEKIQKWLFERQRNRCHGAD